MVVSLRARPQTLFVEAFRIEGITTDACRLATEAWSFRFINTVALARWPQWPHDRKPVQTVSLFDTKPRVTGLKPRCK